MTRGPELPQREARMETISVTLRRVAPKSIAVTDGSETDYTDPDTGEVTRREKWVFLPRFYIESEGIDDLKDTDALEALKGKAIEITASEKMLAEKGLI